MLRAGVGGVAGGGALPAAGAARAPAASPAAASAAEERAADDPEQDEQEEQADQQPEQIRSVPAVAIAGPGYRNRRPGRETTGVDDALGHAGLVDAGADADEQPDDDECCEE